MPNPEKEMHSFCNLPELHVEGEGITRPVSDEFATKNTPNFYSSGEVASNLTEQNGQKTEVDSRLARVANLALVSAAAGSLLFEQSPANEALRTNVAFNVLDNTGNALAVGGTVAVVTAGIELAPSVMISLGLHRKSGLVQKLKSRALKRQDEKSTDEEEVSSEGRKTNRLATAGADTAVALGLGAGLVVIKKHVEDSAPTLSKDLKNSVKATGIVAGVSGFIGYLVGGGIQNAHKIGLGTPAEYVVDYGSDTKFWMSVLGIGYGGYFLKKYVSKFRGGNKNQSQLAKEVNL